MELRNAIEQKYNLFIENIKQAHCLLDKTMVLSQEDQLSSSQCNNICNKKIWLKKLDKATKIFIKTRPYFTSCYKVDILSYNLENVYSEHNFKLCEITKNFSQCEGTKYNFDFFNCLRSKNVFSVWTNRYKRQESLKIEGIENIEQDFGDSLSLFDKFNNRIEGSFIAFSESFVKDFVMYIKMYSVFIQ